MRSLSVMISISWPLLYGVPGGLWTCSIPKVMEFVLFIAACCCMEFISYKDECRDCGSKGVTVPRSSRSSDCAMDTLEVPFIPFDDLLALQPANETGEQSLSTLVGCDGDSSSTELKSK